MIPQGSDIAGLVHVLDDDEHVRIALARLLRAAGFEVRTHASPASYLAEPATVSPCCLVLDERMPEVSGLEMQEALVREGSAVPIIFLTGHGDIPMSVRAMRAGAIDVLTKPVDRDLLLGAVTAAFARHATAVSGQQQLDEVKGRYGKLTAREREVFEGVSAGKLNKQVAADLDISERTVKAHRSQVMEKMQARSVADLVRAWELLQR
ncbi:Response regulator protein TmoT [Usitatibacter rugosus]|uniref:Response regulator protein TmoT n=1 Tax=Usitatibacter rugosus TaxID=2732067 RepID=A0A6M4GUD3_9PROT|nr:response regulator [Usitatibacter rugosus]QJR10458.1 Response regulator protein TmoT [Usitatibacter rugosus]